MKIKLVLTKKDVLTISSNCLLIITTITKFIICADGQIALRPMLGQKVKKFNVE